MVIKICPRCQMRFSFNPYTDVDFIHACNSGNDVFDKEDVGVIGPYVDEASGETVWVNRALMQDEVNKLWPGRGWIDGNKLGDFTDRGNNADTTRTRKHYEYILLTDEFKYGKKRK